MNKREFESFILRNLDRVDAIHCTIFNGSDMDGNDCSWLDVFIAGDESVSIFCSEDFAPGDKALISLQKKWVKKLEGWINPFWDKPLKVEEVNV